MNDCTCPSRGEAPHSIDCPADTVWPPLTNDEHGCGGCEAQFVTHTPLERLTDRAAAELRAVADELTDRVRPWVLNVLRDRADELDARKTCDCGHLPSEHLPWGGCLGGPIDDPTCECTERTVRSA